MSSDKMLNETKIQIIHVSKQRIISFAVIDMDVKQITLEDNEVAYA